MLVWRMSPTRYHPLVGASLILLQWYPEVRQFCPNTPVLLVGLKSDLRHNARAISILRTQGQAPITFQEVVIDTTSESNRCRQMSLLNRWVHSTLSVLRNKMME